MIHTLIHAVGISFITIFTALFILYISNKVDDYFRDLNNNEKRDK
jgi:hypothetical protein